MTIDDILILLQHRLAQIDLLSEHYRKSNSNLPEFLVCRQDKLKIKMYQEHKHRMPHIHIDYGIDHHVASFSLVPPSRIKGSLNRKYDASIIDFLTTHSNTLLEIWNKAQSGGTPESLIAELKNI